jgi:hypothetical protein
MNPREIRGIGATKFVAMEINTQNIKSVYQNHKNSTNLEIKIRGNFGAIFWIFEIFVEITNESKSVATKSC